jgi:hypothetical protein
MTSPCGAMHPPSPGGSTLGKIFPAGTRLQEGMETVPNYIQSVSINLAPHDTYRVLLQRLHFGNPHLSHFLCFWLL